MGCFDIEIMGNMYYDVLMSTQIWEIMDFESGISWGTLGESAGTRNFIDGL